MVRDKETERDGKTEKMFANLRKRLKRKVRHRKREREPREKRKQAEKGTDE